MELYEIMLIIRPDLEAEEREEVLSGLSSVIEKNNGKVETVLDWHKRRLAYEINKHVEGYYYLIYFNGPGTIIPETEHYFRVNDAIIRYMTVCTDEKILREAAEKAAKEAERTAESAEVADDEAEKSLEDQTEDAIKLSADAEEAEAATAEAELAEESDSEESAEKPDQETVETEPQPDESAETGKHSTDMQK